MGRKGARVRVSVCVCKGGVKGWCGEFPGALRGMGSGAGYRPGPFRGSLGTLHVPTLVTRIRYTCVGVLISMARWPLRDRPREVSRGVRRPSHGKGGIGSLDVVLCGTLEGVCLASCSSREITAQKRHVRPTRPQETHKRTLYVPCTSRQVPYGVMHCHHPSVPQPHAARASATPQIPAIHAAPNPQPP